MASNKKDVEVTGSKDITLEEVPAAKAKDEKDTQKLGLEQRNVGTLQRRLKSRHVQFLALSGAIGTGLFISTGQTLSLAGPLSAFLSYLITGFNLYAVINSMGEMATWLPLPGAVPVYAADSWTQHWDSR